MKVEPACVFRNFKSSARSPQQVLSAFTVIFERPRGFECKTRIVIIFAFCIRLLENVSSHALSSFNHIRMWHPNGTLKCLNFNSIVWFVSQYEQKKAFKLHKKTVQFARWKNEKSVNNTEKNVLNSIYNIASAAINKLCTPPPQRKTKDFWFDVWAKREQCVKSQFLLLSLI